MSIILSGLLGALLATLTSFLYNIWKYHRDEHSARIDEICNAIFKAADIASEYWSENYNVEINLKQKIAEAKISSSQNIIDGLYSGIRCYFKESAAIEIDICLSELTDSLTGGDFSVEGRKRDVVRIGKSNQSAGEVVILIRKHHRETLPLFNFFKGYHDNKYRKIDMPLGWNGD